MSTKKKARLVTSIASVAGIIAAVIAAADYLTPPRGPEPTTETETTIHGGGGGIEVSEGCITVGDGDCTFQLDPSTSDNTSLREEADRFADVTPEAAAGDGPYPFLVVDSLDGGLWARTGGTEGDVRLGAAREHSIVWAACAVDTDFNPAPDVPGGARWAHIHWPETTASDQFRSGQPSDPVQAWMHNGHYLMPLGHNGRLPDCV